jgi:cysteine desulfurase / selenocysteine lyase
MKKSRSFDPMTYREDFPVLQTQMNKKPLTYLDNAATAQKPLSVIKAMNDFITNENATIHRGIYELSQRATNDFEAVRLKCQYFLNAKQSSEIIFVRGTTEAINLVAASFGRKFFKEGDEIIISALEHHANIVPWQQLCIEKKLKLRVIPMNDDGELLISEYEKLLSDRTVMVAVNHVSNALGTINPIKEIISKAHGVGAKVLIDGAQGICHHRIDVQELDADFYAFSSHKLYGPTGIGVLYAKAELLDVMDPYQCGGEMIETVTFEKTTFAKPPAKFEAGTPAIIEVIGMGAAIDYVESIGIEQMAAYEQELLEYATCELGKIKGLRIIGTAKNKAAIISFVIDGIHPHDIGTILDQEGVCIRAGHHCAQPIMQHFKIAATARASFSFYNVKEDVDNLVRGLHKVQEIFGAK